MSQPFFSVLIPVYNKASHLERTLGCVKTQTFTDYEVIAVNDGSTDNSLEVLKASSTSKMRIIEQTNQGPAVARNTGIKASQGKWIAFLDADDEWTPDHLQGLHDAILQCPDAVLATSFQQIQDAHGALRSARYSNHEGLKQHCLTSIFPHMMQDALIHSSCCAVNASIVEQVGLFDTSITYGAGEDTDYWIRWAIAGPVALSTATTSTYRQDATNRVSKTDTRKRTFADFTKYTTYASSHPGLADYINLNQYSLAIQHKRAGLRKSYQDYRRSIDLNALNVRQRFLLGLPAWALRLAYRLRGTRWLSGNKFSVYEA